MEIKQYLDRKKAGIQRLDTSPECMFQERAYRLFGHIQAAPVHMHGMQVLNDPEEQCKVMQCAGSILCVVGKYEIETDVLDSQKYLL